MSYEVKIVWMKKSGFWWNRSFSPRSTVVCETEDRDSALRFAEDYPFWANQNVVVHDNTAGYAHTIFMKLGGEFFKGTALEG